MSEWISVEDRLPDYGEPVLVVSNGVVAVNALARVF